MTLDNEFFDILDKLKNHRNSPAWEDFFDTIDELEKLGKEINDEMHESPADTSELDKRARTLTKKLADNKDEIAKRTKTQEEYDAVYDCIGHLEDHFNYTK